jgi:glutamine amidotransferase
MNCNAPADFSFSFRGFCERGGNTDKHKDGWGLAVYDDFKRVRKFMETEPAACSTVAKLVHALPIKTCNMIAHIRYATCGGLRLENVHPFIRELWGSTWTFAHNGDLPRMCRSSYGFALPFGPDERFQPVGDTDSEVSFCFIMNELHKRFPSGRPPLPVLYTVLEELCRELGSADGAIFNMLLSDGHTMIASSWPGSRPGSTVWNGLYYVVREAPFSVAHLTDCDYSLDFSTITRPDDRIAMVVSKPLTTNERWIEFQRGDLVIFVDGAPLKSLEDVNRYQFEVDNCSCLSATTTSPDESASELSDV